MVPLLVLPALYTRSFNAGCPAGVPARDGGAALRQFGCGHAEGAPGMAVRQPAQRGRGPRPTRCHHRPAFLLPTARAWRIGHAGAAVTRTRAEDDASAAEAAIV